MVLTSCKCTAPPESPRTASGPRIASGSLLPLKKQKHINTSLFPDSLEWPSHNKLWEVVGDRGSEFYLKSQNTLEEYTPAACIFFGRLLLVVRGLHLDQLIVIFRASAPSWFTTVARDKKAAMIEAFKEAQAWVDQKIVAKMKAFSEIWYQSPTGAAYYNKWYKNKYVLFIIVI